MSGTDAHRSRWVDLAIAGVFGLLAAVHTWPLAKDPAHLGRLDNADTQLNAWIVTWIPHQLLRAPLDLFDANIFHPVRRTLAFSEPLIPPALLGAPVGWFGGSPVLTYNLLVLLGFASSGFAMYWVVFRWTGDRVAGVLAGSVWAFNAHTMGRIPQLQALHTQAMPLALYSLERVLSPVPGHHTIWLALALSALAYTSGYSAVFGVVMVTVATLASPEQWWGRAGLPRLRRLAVAALLTAVVVLPLWWQYRLVDQEHGLARSAESIAAHSASLRSYALTTARVHYELWASKLYERGSSPFFPGAIALGFAAAAAVPLRRAWRDLRLRRLLAIAACGLVLSFGPALPFYGIAAALFPPIESLRAVARFGNLVMLAVAALAGIGLCRLRAAHAGRRWIAVASVALVALANVEALHAPYHYERFEGIPEIYSLVANLDEPGALAEFPLYSPPLVFHNGRYVLASTAHWRPLVNGYSGHVPGAYRELAGAVRNFPDDRAIAALRNSAVRYVIVHLRDYPPSSVQVLRQALGAQRHLRLIVEDEEGRQLYEIVRPGEARTDDGRHDS